MKYTTTTTIVFIFALGFMACQGVLDDSDASDSGQCGRNSSWSGDACLCEGETDWCSDNEADLDCCTSDELRMAPCGEHSYRRSDEQCYCATGFEWCTERADDYDCCAASNEDGRTPGNAMSGASDDSGMGGNGSIACANDSCSFLFALESMITGDNAFLYQATFLSYTGSSFTVEVQPLRSESAREPVGDSISGAGTVHDDGSFTISLMSVVLSPESNPMSDSTTILNVELTGVQCGAGKLCGRWDGQMFAPSEMPLPPGTWGAVATEDPTRATVLTDCPADCAACHPQDDRVCFDGDAKWANSCGERGELLETCGSDEICASGRCRDREPPCSLSCSGGSVGLTCGTGSVTCSYSYNSSGCRSGANCTYSNGRSFSCTLTSCGERGSCRGEGDSCSF